jgi:transposase
MAMTVSGALLTDSDRVFNDVCLHAHVCVESDPTALMPNRPMAALFGLTKFIYGIIMLTFITTDHRMPKRQKTDRKILELTRTGTLNTHAAAVSDTLFKENPFFDPKDLLQVRYEMLRRHSIDGQSIVEVANNFGVSRPTVYQAQLAFEKAGLSGLLPKRRGPKEGHKLSDEVIDYVRSLRAADASLTIVDCIQAVQAKFSIKVHRRSLERALGSKKKPINPTENQ